MYLQFGRASSLLFAAICLATTCTAYEGLAGKVSAERVQRGLVTSPLTSQGRVQGQSAPSPTFPNPRNQRFRREAYIAAEPIGRYVRSFEPYQNPKPWPTNSPTIPRPEDILHRPVSGRFKRGGGSVSVDVEKNRGTKSTTRVTAEQNVYRSSDGRTRVDASGYATNRGDRGGMINFSHRF